MTVHRPTISPRNLTRGKPIRARQRHSTPEDSAGENTKWQSSRNGNVLENDHLLLAAFEQNELSRPEPPNPGFAMFANYPG